MATLSQRMRPFRLDRRVLYSLLLVMIIQDTWALLPSSPSPHQRRCSITPSQILFPATRSSTTRLLTHYDKPRQAPLHMGFRSMIDKFGRKKRDDDSELEAKKEKETPIPPSPVAKDPVTEKSPKASTGTNDQAAKTPVPTPVLRKSTPPVVRMGEDPTTRQVNVQAMDRQESTQERINRVKSGKMTEKEKAAFLETALSAGTATESRKPLRGPEEERKKRGVASPFPSDSILRNFARGKNATNGAGRDEGYSGTSKNSADEQKKKRDYLDMVTSPDRFQRYKASAKSEGGGVSRISGSIGGDRKTYIPDIADIDLEDSNIAEPQIPFAPDIGSRPDGPDLGARLEAAAIANENLRQQQEEDRRKLSIEAEKQRSERMKQNAVLEQQRLKEFARQEADVQARKQQEQENITREQDEKKLVELKRLEALMKAQEDYWTRKLATERGAKEALRDSAPKAEVAEAAPKEKVAEADSQKPVQAAAVEKPFAGPDERNLLELAEHDREEGWAHNQEVIERKAAEITGRRPSLNDVQTEKSWMEEQTKHKSDVDRLRDEQLQRLKALNSPLPSPRAAEPPTIPPAFQQSRVVPPSPSAPPARSLGNMLRSMNNKGSTEKEGDSIKVDTGAVSQSEVPPPTRSDLAPPADRRLSISELTKRKKAPDASEEKEDTATTWSNLVGNAKETPVKQQPPPQEQKPKDVDPPKERKGPIRMQIPQGDGDDGEDDDNLSSNKSMSIADAMKKTTGGDSTAPANQKENSKKWGVDMSRFL